MRHADEARRAPSASVKCTFRNRLRQRPVFAPGARAEPERWDGAGTEPSGERDGAGLRPGAATPRGGEEERQHHRDVCGMNRQGAALRGGAGRGVLCCGVCCAVPCCAVRGVQQAELCRTMPCCAVRCVRTPRSVPLSGIVPRPPCAPRARSRCSVPCQPCPRSQPVPVPRGAASSRP